MRNITTPSLPQSNIGLAVVGAYPIILDKLHDYNIETNIIGESDALSPAVSRHADMLCLHMPNNKLFSYGVCIDGFDCVAPKAAPGSKYPDDVRLNCLILNNTLICNTRYCAVEVLEYAKSLNMKTVHVNQGYARCSTAVIDSCSVITADRGIYEALKGENVDVLLVRSGYIDLPGYNYGFIGGCCGKLSRNRMLFSGDLCSHPDSREIIDFVEQRGVEIICASNRRLFDFGGFVPLKEYSDEEGA